MLLPSGCSSPDVYVRELSAFLTSELFTLVTAQVHHLDIIPRPNSEDGDWEQLPAEWRSWFDSALSPDHLQSMLAGVRLGQECEERPESLDSFIDSLNRLALPRALSHQIARGDVSEGRIVPGLNAKKSHEVSRFARLVGDLATERGVRRIIDIGAGQGYLTRTIATLQPSFAFLAIDGSASQLAGSQRLSPELSERITYVTAFIQSPDSAREQIQTWLGGEEAILIGLHCCGCLTDDMLGMFQQIEDIKGLVVAGCCFNHLRTSSCPGVPFFPSSARLRASKIRLSSTALMAACQDMSNWANADSRPAVVERRTLARKKTHFRRLLTALLADPLFPTTPAHLPLGSIQLTRSDSFVDYALRALAKINIPLGESEGRVKDIASELEEKYGGWRWEGKGRVVETLAKVCGGVVESVIAMDRLLMLRETDEVSADLVLGWDYAQSPRNIVIVAVKDEL